MDLNLKQQGFIVEMRDKAAPSIAKIPENRTLLMAQLTDKPPSKPEVVYEMETMEDVFKHFQPACKIEYQNEAGASMNENMEFRNLGDFTQKAFIERSSFLSDLDQKKSDHEIFSKRLQANRLLQTVLKDPEKKEAYLTILKSLIQELEG